MVDTRQQMAALGFSGHADSAQADHSTTHGSEPLAPGPVENGSLLAGRLAGLAGLVQEQVVPRLIEAHRPVTNEPLVPTAELNKPQAGVVSELAELVIADGDAATAYVQQLHEAGLPVEAIYLNVLAPTARLLGKFWETDRYHFADVTVGVGHLQRMLHDFESTFQSTATQGRPALRALLMPAPNEQHTFGLFMIGEFMRRAGWDAWTGPLPADKDLKALISYGNFSVVGISASSDRRLALLTKTIATVRRLTGDRSLCIMVGGSLFSSNPSLVAEVGADGTAADAKQAIILAHKLLGQQTQCSETNRS